MTGTGNFTLTDAITRLMRRAGRRETGKPAPIHSTAAEQARETQGVVTPGMPRGLSGPGWRTSGAATG